MAKLILDINYDYDFALIGISCHEKEYRICWALNNSLNIDLAKTSDLKIDTKKFNEPLTHAMFEFDSIEQNRQYYLIANRGEKGLLVAEQKQADFFLIIKGVLPNNDKLEIIKHIREMAFVLTAFEINPNQLKSKENLLF
ncbi:MAG: IPExxxVDY family protein [Bacteroidia bacterium]|nr:IPExxxVDY family protein [Bacteroidia bacterium]